MTILEAAQLKATGKAKRLVVAGCLVERYRDELKAAMPEVDAFIGTSQINEILAVCDLAIVTGLNNVPSLRQIAETLQAVKNAERVPPQIVVVLNRCESGLVGGIARRGHVSRALGSQTVVYVREDAAAANHSLNTGVPISMTSPSSKITKDIRALASLVSGLRPGRAQVTGSSNSKSSR